MSVIVTRPQGQADELVELLAKENIKAFSVPVVEFEPPQDSEKTTLQLKAINENDTCIFISRQAVHGAVEYLGHVPKCHLIAIGKGTADALYEHGAEEVIFPENASSEGLLAEMDADTFKNNPVHIIRGGDGKETLFNALKQQNVNVQYINTYHRRCKKENAKLLLEHMLKDDVDLVVLTSCQLADMFLELLGEQQHRINALTVTTMSKEMMAWAVMKETKGVLPLASGKNERIVEQIVAYYRMKHEREGQPS